MPLRPKHTGYATMWESNVHSIIEKYNDLTQRVRFVHAEPPQRKSRTEAR